MTFNELVRQIQVHGYCLIREKGSVRYYAKEGCDQVIRIDYHGSKEVPTGTCRAILKAAGISRN
ncbi:MAG: type II toxin-antitoxin system HicA family toxin [Isosphaeraceae bacterium]